MKHSVVHRPWDSPLNEVLCLDRADTLGLKWKTSDGGRKLKSNDPAVFGFDEVFFCTTSKTGITIAGVVKHESQQFVVTVQGDTRSIAHSSVQVWGASHASVTAMAKSLAEKLCAEPEVPREDLVEMNVYYLTSTGATTQPKMVEVMPVETVLNNYPGDVQPELKRLAALKEPGDHPGRIIVMHGPPGTGKTTLIRGLASTWRDWAKFRIILDPEKMFNDVGYMLQALTVAPTAKEPWRVVVLEDSGNLLVRQRGGDQGLARLLNMADGIAGQGNKVLFLITTNENIKELDPAVIRPGRCLAEMRIGELSAPEASKWLGRRVDEPKTLADLYAIKHANPTLKDKAATPGLYL